MRKNHAEIIFIIDRSGSMDSIKNDAIGGFNTFLESQKKLPGSASVTLVQFDDKYEVVYSNVNLQDTKPLTDVTYVPRGSTALLDAVGRTINEVGARLASTPEEDRPEKVIICILTDGFENSSREFNGDRIKEMITHQREKYSWEFAFLAANQDAFATGGSYGISNTYTSNFAYNSAGMISGYACMNAMVANYRATV